MDWIKKNPAQTALVAIAVLVLVSTYLLWSQVSGFPETLAAPTAPSQPKKGIPATDVTNLTDSLAAIQATVQWKFDGAKMLYVSDTYVKENGVIKKPEGGFFQKPMSNIWLKKYGLNFLDKNVGNEDPDKDGFSTLVEWCGMDGKSHFSYTEGGKQVQGPDGSPLPDDSTSPIDPQSHPPYYTRLRLATLPDKTLGIVSIPFRLKFMSYDINPKKPTDINVAINTIDVGNRTKFVAIGENIPGTAFMAEKFEKKEITLPNGTVSDKSILTIFNPKTGTRIPLPMGDVVNSPESYVVFHYLWVEPGKAPTADMNKRKDETFKLPPEMNKTYKVVDIKAGDPQKGVPGEVTIEISENDKPILKFTLKTNDKLEN